MQGDIVGLLDSTGALVVEYKYDAWGKLLSVTGNLADTLGKRNPFRYRGYIYDEETGLYYLRNRYYNADLVRFINADTEIGDEQTLLHHNGYIYCGNAPIMYYDQNGFGWFMAGVAIIGAVVGLATQIATNAVSGEKWYNGIMGAMVGGATYNVVSFATGSTAAASYASSAAESATNEVVSYVTGKKKLTSKNIRDSAISVAKDTTVNGSLYVLTGRISNKLHPIHPKWFRPRKSLRTVLTGKFGRHVWKQTAYQGMYNFIGMAYKNYASRVIGLAR